MTRRKQILRRAAQVAAAVFVVGGVGSLVSIALYESWHEGQQRARARAREEQVAQSRDYLAQVARRITRLPVDAAVSAEVQSRYFEEYPKTRIFVWATDTAGGFLFGVPAEEFGRLNLAYDRHRGEIDKDGFYADRNAFLRRLIGHEEIDFSAVLGGDSEEAGWRAFREDDREWSLYSVAMKAPDGAVLGTLYMKVARKDDETWPHSDVAELRQGLFAAATVLSGLFLWFLLPTWVYVDARERGVPRARLWSLLTLISLFVGLIVYLIARPEEAKVLQCPGCGREVNGGAFCPHCGRDLAGAFCSACRYPLEPDWAFCPSCRTEIRRQSVATPPADTASA